MIAQKIHFIDLLHDAHVSAPSSEYVQVQPITIGRETRSSLFNHPPAAITFSKIDLGKNPIFHFGYGIKESCWKLLKSKIYFYIFLHDENGKKISLFKATLKPGSRKADRYWKEHTIDLSRYSDQTVSITFQTLTKWGQPTEWCWSGWSDPVLIHNVNVPSVQTPKTKHPLVLLVTADALRADHLGCYGNQIVKTPHIDQLAREGAVFSHARTQSPSTLGSYASMLTSLFPNKHGISAEWGMFAPEHQSLPKHLQANGFHTIFAPSEEELFRPIRGISNHFNEMIPSMANPSQDGSITTRQVIKRLEKGLDQPTFIWVQYFDTHPPHTLVKPFSTLYYHGDPTDECNAYQKQMVSEIRGIESCLEIKEAFEMLEKGFVPHALYQRLRATARVFRGEYKDGPDLADNLLGLGKSAIMNMTHHDFSLWLDQEAEGLLQCTLSSSLNKWLVETLEKLNVIEAEIISWLDNVVDYRYPLSQYKSAATYFDNELGKLIAQLKEQGLYDQSMIIVTSPHGELLGEYGIAFHHHLIAEEVVRVPLVIKPLQKIPGKYIGGIFDTIDLFPTIVEAMGVPLPLGLDGTSRFKQILNGEEIPEHDSFTINYCETMSSVVRESFIFLQAQKDYYSSPEYHWKAGEKRLYSLTDSLSYHNNLIESHSELAQSMELAIPDSSENLTFGLRQSPGVARS